MKKYRFLATATVGLALLAIPASAVASGAALKVEDRCDEASFNAAVGPGTCERPAGDRGGVVTFDEFIARLERKQAHGAWRFTESLKIKAGESVDVMMTRGGEAHTITEVDEFGLGCVPPLNALVFPGQNPTAFPAQCDDPLTFSPGEFVPGGDLIFPGSSFSIDGLEEGVHRFMCMIHPWMKSKVTVK